MEPLTRCRWRVAIEGGPAAVAQLHAFPLEADAATLAACRALLSEDERRRADRFLSPHDQRRFAVARATLRSIVATVVGADPAALVFDYGAHGKPVLAGGAGGARQPGFNLSHSGELGLVGVTGGAQIGVDIELHRGMTDQDALVRRFFSAAENAEYFALPVADRQQAFFDGWTRKEAVVKALGRGLSYPLKDFDVSLGASSARLLRLDGRDGEASGWCLAALAPAPGYSAAVVVQGRSCGLVAAPG